MISHGLLLSSWRGVLRYASCKHEMLDTFYSLYILYDVYKFIVVWIFRWVIKFGNFESFPGSAYQRKYLAYAAGKTQLGRLITQWGIYFGCFEYLFCPLLSSTQWINDKSKLKRSTTVVLR